eukprot:scaffold13290_cov150-Isochrysis_galbana.AAC.2
MWLWLSSTFFFVVALCNERAVLVLVVGTRHWWRTSALIKAMPYHSPPQPPKHARSTLSLASRELAET